MEGRMTLGDRLPLHCLGGALSDRLVSGLGVVH